MNVSHTLQMGHTELEPITINGITYRRHLYRGRDTSGQSAEPRFTMYLGTGIGYAYRMDSRGGIWGSYGVHSRYQPMTVKWNRAIVRDRFRAAFPDVFKAVQIPDITVSNAHARAIRRDRQRPEYGRGQTWYRYIRLLTVGSGWEVWDLDTYTWRAAIVKPETVVTHLLTGFLPTEAQKVRYEGYDGFNRLAAFLRSCR